MRAEVEPTIAGLRRRVAAARGRGSTIACVPTMGALHAGHGALIEQARALAGYVVVTAFVNPIQFDRKEDYERYARHLDADREFCAAREVDAVFAPAVEEMYPVETGTFVDVPELGAHLCGAFRPGHFRGVATVVAKLFSIVQPDVACFGEKDAQQLAVIEAMVRDLNFPVRIVPVGIVREADGLALSSRNVRLTAEERRAAPVLFRALGVGQRAMEDGELDAGRVKKTVLDELRSEPLMRPEYVEVVDARMQPVTHTAAGERLMAAAWLGSTRLIDNVRLTEPPPIKK